MLEEFDKFAMRASELHDTVTHKQKKRTPTRRRNTKQLKTSTCGGKIGIPVFTRGAPCRTALDLCRVALTKGSLVRDGNTWRYGRRRFSNATVKRLLDDGTAIRSGTIIRATPAQIGCS